MRGHTVFLSRIGNHLGLRRKINNMNDNQPAAAPAKDARETLNDLFETEFESNIGKTALALGRDEADITEIITGNAAIDEDLTEKIHHMAQIRLDA